MESLTLFYDADCGICTASVDWLARQAAEAGTKLETVAYQDSSGPGRYPMINWQHVDLGVQSLSEGGVIRKDAPAIAACLRLSPKWRWLGTCLDWPIARIGAQAGYRLIARNRRTLSRWLGLAACKLPTPPAEKV